MLDNYKVGDYFELKRVFTLEDVRQFSIISEDHNPIHLDPEFASKTQFKRPIVHGIFAASIFSAIIANELPGPGSIYLSQTLSFKAPIFHNEPIFFKVEVVGIREDKPIYTLKTSCVDNSGISLIEGEAVIKWNSNG